MSRIGKAPIQLPAGVTVTVLAENNVTVKGPQGELKAAFCPRLTITVDGFLLGADRGGRLKGSSQDQRRAVADTT